MKGPLLAALVPALLAGMAQAQDLEVRKYGDWTVAVDTAFANRGYRSLQSVIGSPDLAVRRSYDQSLLSTMSTDGRATLTISCAALEWEENAMVSIAIEGETFLRSDDMAILIGSDTNRPDKLPAPYRQFVEYSPPHVRDDGRIYFYLVSLLGALVARPPGAPEPSITVWWWQSSQERSSETSVTFRFEGFTAASTQVTELCWHHFE